MAFYDELQQQKEWVKAEHRSVDRALIEYILHKRKLTLADFWALISQEAEPYLELIAGKAHELSKRFHGQSVLLYAPIYLSNYCVNKCIYCSFNHSNKLLRKKLTVEEVEEEAKALAATGIRHVIILTGEAPNRAGLAYLKECLNVLKKYFSSITLEVYPMVTEDYRELADLGADGLTIYQETYDEKLYDEIHLAGPKKNYRFRLDAPERACLAGFHSVNIGALLGLAPWREEALYTAFHLQYLQDHYPAVMVSVSFPRLRPHVGSYDPAFPLSDKNLVQLLLAFRVFLPQAGITMSTRERADFRDHLIPLGVTKMSAGSMTTVGGYAKPAADSGQFDISDDRSVDEVKAAILKAGYQPIMQNWCAF